MEYPVAFPESADQCHATHIWHRNVCQHTADGVLLLGEQGKRFGTVAGGQNPVIVLLENHFGDLKNVRLIIDNQDLFAVTLSRVSGIFRFVNFRVSDSCRQEYFECRSSAGLAFNGQEATVAFDDSKRGGKAKTRALTFFLGSKEWLENLVDHTAWDALTVIAHPDHDVGTGRCSQSHCRIILIYHDILCCKKKGAAGGHGITGIDGNIEQDLVELSWIAFDRP